MSVVSIWVYSVSFSSLFVGVILFVIVWLKPNFFNVFCFEHFVVCFLSIAFLVGFVYFSFLLLFILFFFGSLFCFVVLYELVSILSPFVSLMFFLVWLYPLLSLFVSATMNLFIVGVISLDKCNGSLDDFLLLGLHFVISSWLVFLCEALKLLSDRVYFSLTHWNFVSFASWFCW